MQATVEDVREQLRRARCETLEGVDLLHSHRQNVAAQYSLFEDPKAVLDYLDTFIEMFGMIAADLARLDRDLEQRVSAEQASALRQIASNAAVEQQRCLQFRDRCINRPLPHESVRALLNQVSNDTRDQLLSYRNLNIAATHVDAIFGAAPEPPGEGRSFDRRSLFTRFLPKKD
ncbi:MAG TPA: hypothetical protein VHZ73_12935 [Vicinamibacterales bacterium]|jgi:hypothetical protein|nr:hypothetical protein [Vicinamibacterales bacterium]